MKKITIYTDGACSGNPGPGGWGAVLIYKNSRREISGSESETTNNRMELLAAIESLKTLKEPCEIDIYIDSKYVLEGITTWITNWKKNNWLTASKKSVKNVDLWQELDKYIQNHKISWHWVKGHSGNIENDIADQLAVNAYKKLL